MSQTRGFQDLDETTAPAAARPMLAATRDKLGFVPAAMARIAAVPGLVRAFQQGLAAFDGTSLRAREREAAVLAIAQTNGCEVCVAMHRGALVAMGEGRVAEAVLAEAPTGEPKLDALLAFTRAVLTHKGDVPGGVWARFLEVGYTREQALEVVLGVGTYTLSTYANRLTQAPVDAPLREGR
jgi:AhpD family alkylhydroperoxidase